MCGRSRCSFWKWCTHIYLTTLGDAVRQRQPNQFQWKLELLETDAMLATNEYLSLSFQYIWLSSLFFVLKWIEFAWKLWFFNKFQLKLLRNIIKMQIEMQFLESQCWFLSKMQKLHHLQGNIMSFRLFHWSKNCTWMYDFSLKKCWIVCRIIVLKMWSNVLLVPTWLNSAF